MSCWSSIRIVRRQKRECSALSALRRVSSSSPPAAESEPLPGETGVFVGELRGDAPNCRSSTSRAPSVQRRSPSHWEAGATRPHRPVG